MQEQVYHRVGMLFVRHDLGESAARGIVDTNMGELPSGTAMIALACAIAGDAMPISLKHPSFLMSMWMRSPRARVRSAARRG
jgi:hypothetical protein